MSLALIAAGCGSGDDDTDTRRADQDRVHQAGRRDLRQGQQEDRRRSRRIRRGERHRHGATRARRTRKKSSTTVVAPALQTQADELGALGAPEGEEDKVDGDHRRRSKAAPKSSKTTRASCSRQADPTRSTRPTNSPTSSASRSAARNSQSLVVTVGEGARGRLLAAFLASRPALYARRPMDLTLSPSEEQFRDEVRDLARREPSRPRARRASTRSMAFRREWQRKLHDAGWAGISWPKEYGGRGATMIEQAIFVGEAARAGSAAARPTCSAWRWAARS